MWSNFEKAAQPKKGKILRGKVSGGAEPVKNVDETRTWNDDGK